MLRSDKLILAMIDRYGSDTERIGRMLKVHGLARAMGLEEHLDGQSQELLEAAAILHEIGADLALELYGDELPAHRAELAPGAAEELLFRLGCGEDTARGTAKLLSDPLRGESPAGQILLDAESLIALAEGRLSPEERAAAESRVKTELGRRFLRQWFAGW